MITSETKIMFGNFPSGRTFAHSVLNKIRLSHVPYFIVSVHKDVICVTNKVLTSRHECVLGRYTCDLDMPKRLANCKFHIKYC